MVTFFTSALKKNAKKAPQILELKQKDVTLHMENQCISSDFPYGEVGEWLKPPVC